MLHCTPSRSSPRISTATVIASLPALLHCPRPSIRTITPPSGVGGGGTGERLLLTRERRQRQSIYLQRKRDGERAEKQKSPSLPPSVLPSFHVIYDPSPRRPRKKAVRPSDVCPAHVLQISDAAPPAPPFRLTYPDPSGVICNEPRGKTIRDDGRLH